MKCAFFELKVLTVVWFGFEYLVNVEKIIFMGYETLHLMVFGKVEGSKYMMRKAFLDSEKNKFHTYGKNYSTVKSSQKTGNSLNVKRLTLRCAEDFHGSCNRETYF